MLLVPDSPGRHPLVVISHGSPRHEADRAGMSPAYFIDMGKWLVDQGFAVAIPMRRGYGLSQGSWAEGYRSCKDPDYARAGRASAQDIEAVVSYMWSQKYIDASHIVLVGHSAGGWGSIAAASESPPGVVAVVAFAPGRGSLTPDEVCGGNALVAAAGLFGTTTSMPTLWTHSENGHFFSPKLASDIFEAFHATTHGAAEFIESPSCGNDGHMLIRRCPDAWHSIVAAFLQKAVVGN